MIKLQSDAVGFKEWLVVCDALGAGRQSIILRKGGIAEGRGGFQWQRESFLLFPTHFHQQRDQVHWTPTPQAEQDWENPEMVVIRHAASIESSVMVTDWDVAASLAPLHVWTESVVKERFGYGGEAGLSVAIVRIFRLVKPMVFAMEKRFGGCRSWVDLPAASSFDLTPVLDDDTHASRVRQATSLLEATPAR